MGFAASAAEAPATRPVPGVAEQYRARKIVREAFQEDYDAVGRGERSNASAAHPGISLAQKLYEQALRTEDDPAARYVLFCEARDVAAGAGDAGTVCRAVRGLVRDFGMDEMKVLPGALEMAARAAKGAEPLGVTVRAALNAVDRAVDRDNYVAAMQLVVVAAEAAEKGRNEISRQRVGQQRREVESLRAEYERVKEAKKTLAAKPDDPDANLLVGRYLCYGKGDFRGGLPMLAKGADAGLRALAERELGRGEETPLLQIANTWWDLAESETGLARRRLQQHAASLYSGLLVSGTVKLEGLNRSLAEKRIETVEGEAMKALSLEPGLYAELFDGTDFSQRLKTRIDRQIDFDWGEAAVEEGLPKDNFCIRWTGLVRVRPALSGANGTPGQYQLVVIANTGVRIWVDEKLVLDGANLSRNRNGVRVPLRFSEAEAPDVPFDQAQGRHRGLGLHSLRVEYWDTSGIARMRLLWQAPGSNRDEPIPGDVFLHDSLASSHSVR